MRFSALRHPLAPFAIATLAPVPFLLLGGYLGTAWLIPAFLWLTAVKLAADRLLSEIPRLPAWAGRPSPETDTPAHDAVPAEPESVPLTTPPDSAPKDAASEAMPDEAQDEIPPANPDDIDSTIASLVRNETEVVRQQHPAFAPLASDLASDGADPAPLATGAAPAKARRGVSPKALLARLPFRLPARGPVARGAGRLAAADRLSVLLAGAHFLLLVAAVYGLSGRAGYGPAGWIIAFFAFGIWFGQVSNSNAHELIHRHDRRLRTLGAAIYVTLLFGHHTSAHRLVHHRFVATLDDPNSAHLGESFYQFVLRAWPGSFIAGYEMESAIRQRRAARRRFPPVHPYVWYLGGALLTAALVLSVFGFSGFCAWVLLAAYAQAQLLLSDYVQHYGLRRRALSLGKVEPLGPRHSWDAPQPFSSALMLNAPRHASHHLHPGRPWSEPDPDGPGLAPLLPYSLPVMGAIALWPARWRRLMDKRARLVAGAA